MTCDDSFHCSPNFSALLKWNFFLFRADKCPLWVARWQNFHKLLILHDDHSSFDRWVSLEDFRVRASEESRLEKYRAVSRARCCEAREPLRVETRQWRQKKFAVVCRVVWWCTLISRGELRFIGSTRAIRINYRRLCEEKLCQKSRWAGVNRQ